MCFCAWQAPKKRDEQEVARHKNVPVHCSILLDLSDSFLASECGFHCFLNCDGITFPLQIFLLFAFFSPTYFERQSFQWIELFLPLFFLSTFMASHPIVYQISYHEANQHFGLDAFIVFTTQLDK